jgi:hypothetical protein
MAGYFSWRFWPNHGQLSPAIVFASATLLFCGCAGYRLGSTTGFEAGSRSVQVTPFLNDTIEPRLSDAVTSQLRKQLQQDGTYRLDTKGDADVVVSGSIVEYDRSGLSFQPRDVITPREYRIVLSALVTARERSTGRVLLSRRVSGHTNVRVGDDLTSAERQAVPLLAEDLARNITSVLVDSDWPENP